LPEVIVADIEAEYGDSNCETEHAETAAAVNSLAQKALIKVDHITFVTS